MLTHAHLEGVARQSRGIPQARHVHRVASEASDIDSVIVEHMTVEAVVVPPLPY